MAAGRVSGRFLRGRPEPLLLVATIALVVFHYLARADAIGVHRPGGGWTPLTLPPLPPTAHFALSALLLAVLPVLLARALCGIGPRDLGLGLGRVRDGIAWLGVGVPLALVAARVAADSAAVRAVYPLDPGLSGELGAMVPHALRQFLYFGAWEVLFRGVLLFGLRASVGGAAANAIQTALSVVAHFGRPLDETLAAIPAGLVFGWVDLRVGSIWYIAVVHWVVGAGLDWFILGGGGPG